MMASWNPLEEPTAFTSILHKWKKALRISSDEDQEEFQVDAYGTVSVVSRVKPCGLFDLFRRFDSD